jgi:hypothetical protein
MIRSIRPLVLATSVALSTAALGNGCSHGGEAPRSPLTVSPRLSEQGESIYFGSVFPLGSSDVEPTFVYERRVAKQGGSLISTHVTRSPTGEVALAEEAKHSTLYLLERYQLHTNQLGQRGSVVVSGGDVHFELIDGSRHDSAFEQPGDVPVVVGPTLVGYIHRQLPALRAGKTLCVRLAVLERLETLGFELASVPAASGQTRVRMSPSSFFVGLAVNPVHFTFDSESGKLVRLEGRVPSK